MKPRWILKVDQYNEVIMDQEHGLNFLFLATSGMGTTGDSIALASRVVDFLNSLPEQETLLYPFKR